MAQIFVWPRFLHEGKGGSKKLAIFPGLYCNQAIQAIDILSYFADSGDWQFRFGRHRYMPPCFYRLAFIDLLLATLTS